MFYFEYAFFLKGMDMPTDIPTQDCRVLHVLTLSSRSGEYGGPVRVAREICSELNARGYQTLIFSGSLKGSAPTVQNGINQMFFPVFPISKRFPISSLFSLEIIKPLIRYIKEADIIHIHFARDLIPFLAAIICIINKKSFVTQTHGMITSDRRKFIRIIDLFFTKPLLNRSKVNLVLTKTEELAIKELNIKSPSKVLPNGISVNKVTRILSSGSKKVIFCSRLDKRKGLDKFIKLAEIFRDSDVVFDIYGPDYGELSFVENEIIRLHLQKKVKYRGAIPNEKVQPILASSDLLILPSVNEPFPMIVLEALAVGTPVLVMPSCGLAEILINFESKFVSKSEDVFGLVDALREITANNSVLPASEDIKKFCLSNFDIVKITEKLIDLYFEEL